MTLGWVKESVGMHADYSASPLWGHLAEDEDGCLLVPAWWWVQRRHIDDSPGGWWNRGLDLRNPLHWLPYLRSRLGRRVAMVEAC